MNEQEIKRLEAIEKRVKEIFQEEELNITDVLFEIVPAQKVLEGRSYMFPVNFSHWSFGRDYERNRTIYEHTGGGIPYEQVWNFDVPKAYMVETNPFVLNALIISHVFGHVDFFLSSRYLNRFRDFSDVALEARVAANRFRDYEEQYGKWRVEQLIDAAMSIQWQQHPDIFIDEPSDEMAREYLIMRERAKLESIEKSDSAFHNNEERLKKITEIKKNIEALAVKTPPEPLHDLLKYIIDNSPKPLEAWEKDVLRVVRNQARCLAPQARTKMLNEGWASYWHLRVTRRLFQEGILKQEEHGIFNHYHSMVVRPQRLGFNPYHLGLALFESVEERWDKGQFGPEYEEEKNLFQLANWDTKAGLGRKKIFQIRTSYSDRMAVEEFFTDRFIHENQLYIYEEEEDTDTGDARYVIVNRDPAVIRAILKHSMSGHSTPVITVEDGNLRKSRELLLNHQWTGFELDERYRNGTLRSLHHLWGRPVHLETFIGDNEAVISCEDGKKIDTKAKK